MGDTVTHNYEMRLMDCLKIIDNSYAWFAKSIHMTYMSLAVFECICEQEPCTQKSICDELHYTKQNVNTIVKSFIDQGYVELQEMHEDRRSKQIRLTDEGKRYALVTIERLWQAQRDASDVFTEEEFDRFVQMFETYATQIERNTDALIRKQ